MRFKIPTIEPEPGHCVKATEADLCKFGYTLTCKVVAHYDINVWGEDGVAKCRHVEEDKGLDKVADCR